MVQRTFSVLRGDSVRHQVIEDAQWQRAVELCERYHLKPTDLLEILMEYGDIEGVLEKAYGHRL
jgi:hypothetical protein